MLAACSDDILEEGHIEILPETPVDGVVTMQMTSGAQGRIKTPLATRGLSRWQRLEWVATITNPEVQGPERVWSATAIAIDDNNRTAYITWHSDKQAEKEAQVWGGAIDKLDLRLEAYRFNTYGKNIELVTGTNDLLKFNNVFIYGDKLYLSATSARVGGTVARINTADFGNAKINVDCIGFPGNSANAVSRMADGQMIAVSGHDAGAYASFAPEIPAKENYEPGTGITILNPENEIVSNFGGKYVATDENGDTYVLYNKTGEEAKIQKINGGEFGLGVRLVSSDKYAEIYSESGGWQDFETEDPNDRYSYYGKHVLAVKDGYAYVGAGGTNEEKVGLRVYELATGKETWSNATNTIGVYADDDYVYAATGAGLRVYETDGEGHLDLYAYEVENYYGDSVELPADSLLGVACENVQPAIGSGKPRHSPNFVVAHRNPDDHNIYIYVAYGQSGVRVYRLAKETPYYPPTVDTDDPDVTWATEDFPGYYAWGEVFYSQELADKDAGVIGLWGDVAKDENHTLSLHDTTWVNDESYYWSSDKEKGYRQKKTTYTWENYRFFNDSLYGAHTCYLNCSSSEHTWDIDFDDHPETTPKNKEHFLWGYVPKDPNRSDKKYSYVIYGSGKTLSQLYDADDVVRLKWGNGWRMPTQAEWERLIKSARNYQEEEDLYKTTIVDGVEGYKWKVTEKGDSMFFPCTGHYESRTLDQGPGGVSYDHHKECNYWTSTLVVNNWDNAYAVEIDQEDKDKKLQSNEEERYKGLKIRPVREKANLTK